MDLKKQIDSEYSEIVILNNEKGRAIQTSYVCSPIFNPIKDKYPTFEGYEEASDLGLGCGFPFVHANIKAGNTVVDLGCAAGIDSFIIRKIVGETGKVIGFDLTKSLIDRASKIALEKDFKNIEFHQGDIENLPLKNNSVDSVTSNGVFSLLPNLDKAFDEVYRILKKDGTFSMSDINKKSNFSESSYIKVKQFTGCINGIRYQDFYLDKMRKAGFSTIEIAEERVLTLPKNIANEDEQQSLFITNFVIKK
ncbi:methyltransferase domain-containing protein [Aequorivita echinoideorum]|uniref:Arsenite methyltransferase n=1 Tax=Aequorivita echinoideorum TaxID=1549647 RepID=A0ABS5S4U5_9FLAO|nr:methyltransferase domain-containing protein [Aequorivita echinoideorum]MBT0607440.1 methyltransferase domain-containing protein [Aequorivita echinoideorum]